MSITTRLLPCALLTTIPAACKPDCPNGVTDKHGYNCTPIPGTSTDAETTTGDASTTLGEDTSSTGTTPSTTGTSEPCDNDPACGPDETPETCPEQCSDCGDGKKTGDEACDNGDANQTYWPNTPPDGACSESCTLALEWCGDAKQNGNEPCDNGTNSDDVYSPTKPPDTACAPSCTTVGYCGDSVPNGNEPCDTGTQSETCELTCTAPTCGDGITNTPAGEACDDNNTEDGDGCSADCKSIERMVFVTSALFKGDLAVTDDDNLTGLALADFRCQTLATQAGLTGKYKARLSTDTESPSTRFDTTYSGLYRLPSDDFPIVANGWTALTSGTLAHAINADETGAIVQENVFTNTLPDGKSASAVDCVHCSKVNNDKVTFGNAPAADTTWTSADITQCSNLLRLYCFQDL